MPQTGYGYIPDFGQLTEIGQSLGRGYRRNQMGSALQTLGPDASLEDMARVIMDIDPSAGLKTMIEARQAQALEGYRNAQTANAAVAAQPDDLLLWREYQKNFGGGGVPQPSYLAPPDEGSESVPTGVPGTNVVQAQDPENAPAFLTDKFQPSGWKQEREALGKARGERQAKEESKGRYTQDVTSSVEQLINRSIEFDDPSFESALGPWQGSTATDSYSQSMAFFPQTWGEWSNRGKNSTYEVRSAIAGDTEALAAAIKPLIRGPGEGPWTDADQARLVSIVGDLTQSQNKREYYRRLKGVVARINAAFGLQVSIPKLDAAAKTGKLPKEPEPIDMAPESDAPTPRKVQTVPITAPTQQGGPEVERIKQLRSQLDSMPDGSRINGAAGGTAVKRGGQWYNEETGELLQ